MNIFLGYFVWGLILAAPISWLVWRLQLLKWLPPLRFGARLRRVELPPQLDGLVIRGRRNYGQPEPRR